MKYVAYFMPDAIEQFDDACLWYAKQRADLRDMFSDAVDNALDRIEANPEGFPLEHKDFRIVMVNRFPYMLIYRIRGSRVEVHAVFHTHRDLDAWKAKH